MSTNVSSVTKFFPTAQNGFQTTLASTISSGAATVPLNSVAGYTNGDTIVLVVDPLTPTAKQTVTGVVDTSGVQLTGAVWTAGTNQTHLGGVTVVDYATATHISMITKGLLVGHTVAGAHIASLPLTTPKITTSLNDVNGNEIFKIGATASAVNEITLTNAATGTNPDISATGGDTNISLTVTPKGTGLFLLPKNKFAGIAQQRQGGTGGDATWANPGTTNVDTSAKATFMQFGSNTGSAGLSDNTVTFPVTFNQIPLVFVSVITAGSQNTWARVRTISVTTFTYSVLINTSTGATSEVVAWMAVGQ